jgi:hypothetical protein
MKYLLLLHGDESRWAELTPEDLQAVMDEYAALDREMRAAGVRLSGEALDPSSSATTVRVRDGEPALSDGPFAETREQIGGFYLLECADLDEAARWAAKIPAARDGAIEIRPVMDYEAYGYPSDAEAEQAST